MWTANPPSKQLLIHINKIVDLIVVSAGLCDAPINHFNIFMSPSV